jgi:hypothetical protein
VAQKDSSYPLADWEGITFGKIFDFDERDDAWLDSIDDKASALPRDLKQASWMADTYAERHFGRPIPSRRLLINILSDPDFKPSEIIKAIRSGELPAEWLSIALYPKEREFKLEARMFAIVHYKLRYALIAMESNLAKNVFPYLDCQTMTLAMNETLILAGAKFCHGLDRGTDILRGSSSSPSCHIPKALVGLDIVDRYLQHEINWKCPGGIEDPSVQLALDSTFTGDHIVCFLDFLSASAMPLRDCEWICSRPWVDWSVLRVFGTAEEVSGLVRDIVHAAQIVKCARLTDRSWLILSSRWTQRAHMCASNNRLTLSAIPALFSTLALGASATAREELFGSLTLRIPAPGRLDTVREALTASRTLGDVRRVRYDEWTVVLGAIVGAMLLEASPEELRRMYDEVSSDGFLLVPQLGAVQYSRNLDHVLTRIVPPGLSPEQIRALAADLDTEPAPSEY